MIWRVRWYVGTGFHSSEENFIAFKLRQVVTEPMTNLWINIIESRHPYLHLYGPTAGADAPVFYLRGPGGV